MADGIEFPAPTEGNSGGSWFVNLLADDCLRRFLITMVWIVYLVYVVNKGFSDVRILIHSNMSITERRMHALQDQIIAHEESTRAPRKQPAKPDEPEE